MSRAPKPTAPVSWAAMVRAEFRAGFSDLAALSLWVCLGTALCVAALTLYLFSPATMAGPLGRYIPRSGADADAFATVRALRLAQTPPQEPTMVFLGSSAVAQMVGDGRALAQMIADTGAGDWQIELLTTPLQSPLDQIRLAETALDGRSADSPPMVVVVGTGLTRLGWTRARLAEAEVEQEPRIPLTGDWVVAERQRLGLGPPPMSIWAIDNYDFICLNALASLLRLGISRPATQTVDMYANGDGPRHGMRQTLIRQIVAGRAEQDAYFASLARLAARLHAQPGIRVVFLGEPLAPDLIAEGDLAPALAAFEIRLAATAAAAGAEFWPVRREAQVPQDMYYDDIHIRVGPAQTLCRTVIADHMAALATTLEPPQ